MKSKTAQATDAKQLIKEIRIDLRSNSDSDHQKSAQRFHKIKIINYGVKTATVRSIAKKYAKHLKELDKKEVFKICEELMKSDFGEESTIAIQFVASIKNQWEPDDFKVFEQWAEKYINDWSKVDDFCLNVLSHFLTEFPQFVKKTRRWISSEKVWLRRMSAVCFIQGGSWRMNPGFFKDVLNTAEVLKDDPEDLVQKGVGWMLKIAAETHQREVFDFVMKNKSTMARTTLRYAIEKMPVSLKKKAMAK